MLRLVFHLALRQAEGFVGSVLRFLGLELGVPDHTTLSRRSRGFAGRRPRVVPHGPLHLLIDSTGLKLFGQGEWQEAKHGRARRSWRKLVWGSPCQAFIAAPRSYVSLCAARPSGDGGVAVGGELAIGGADLAPRACIRRVPRDPNHDAAMRIGGEAPGRRAHSAPRLGGQDVLKPGIPSGHRPASPDRQPAASCPRDGGIVHTGRCGRPGAGPAAGPERGGRSTARSWRRQRSGRRGRFCGRTGIIRRICGRGTLAPSDSPWVSP